MSSPSADPPDSYLRVHAVNVYVRDQDRSLRFYVDKLGFELTFDACLPGGQRWVAVSPHDGGAVLALIAPNPNTPEYKLIGRATQVVFVTEDVPARYRRMERAGCAVSPYTATAARYIHPAQCRGRREFAGVGRSIHEVRRRGPQYFRLGELRRGEPGRGSTAPRGCSKAGSRTPGGTGNGDCQTSPGETLSQTAPQLSTLEYAGICIQARHVGGDYYDFVSLGRERVGLVIGDIAGKGIAAALLMANLQANLRGQCAIALDHPQVFLRSVNQLFFENSTESAYATLFFAEYDDRTRRLRYANCGHLCGLVLRPDESFERLSSTATVLGFFNEWDCDIEEHQLEAGDTLALYTDGVTESENDGGEEFGERGLREALLRRRGLSPEAMVREIVGEVQRFSPHEQHDDITLIVAKCR